MKKRAPLRKALVLDGMRVYDEAHQIKELFTLKKGALNSRGIETPLLI